jgi:hypothetical protein
MTSGTFTGSLNKEALHSANVRSRPEVAIVIDDTVNGALDAVYIRAAAVELNKEGGSPARD